MESGQTPETSGGFPFAAPREMTFGDVTEPGAYLATESGQMIRVTEDDLASGDFNRVFPLDTWVACLSGNPLESIGRLRKIAGGSGYFVNF